MEQGSLVQSWSPGGHRRSCFPAVELDTGEMSHCIQLGPSPPGLGDTLCLVKCPAKHPLPGLWGPGRAAPAIRKCKKEKYNGKKRKLWVQPLTHGRHSSCLESLFSLFLEQGCDPGHSGAAGRAAGATSLVGTPSNKLSKCVYIYIFIHIYLYLSLSLSCSPRNRGRTNSQARGPDGSSCLQGEQGHPEAHSHTALASSSGFFLAYILQQYRNSLQCPEPWRSRSSGTGADPVPAGAAVLAHTALSQPGARGGHPGGLVGVWELPTPPTIPWLAGGVLVSCLAWGSPIWAGRAGGRVLSAIAALLEHCELTESCSPAEPTSPPTASCCWAWEPPQLWDVLL